MQPLKQIKVIEKFKKIHGEDYEYSHVKYKKSRQKVTIVCRKHGKFRQTPNSHLNGNGCPKCAIEDSSKRLSLSRKQAIDRFESVHGERYDYSQVEYFGMRRNVKIICKEHGEFYQLPLSHIQGSGCSDCAKVKTGMNTPAKLYYIRIMGKYYKIGVTTTSLDVRFSPKELQMIEPIFEVEFPRGKDAYTIERLIIKAYKEFRYIGNDILISGNTEVFRMDVLGSCYPFAKKGFATQ